MKKLLLLTIVLMLSYYAPVETKAEGKKTKHRTVKRMTKRQVRNAQKGKTFYYRNKRGKLKKRLF